MMNDAFYPGQDEWVDQEQEHWDSEFNAQYDDHHERYAAEALDALRDAYSDSEFEGTFEEFVAHTRRAAMRARASWEGFGSRVPVEPLGEAPAEGVAQADDDGDIPF